jgi:hypothetical protein
MRTFCRNTHHTNRSSARPETSSKTMTSPLSERTCQFCGLADGEVDWTTGKIARLLRAPNSDALRPNSECPNVSLTCCICKRGRDELSIFRTLCSTCNQGAKNITSEKPTAIWLLSQIRKAGQDEQLAVMAWLNRKFAEKSRKDGEAPRSK